jgi:glutamate synthase (NADPH/NADH) small chain
MTTQALAPGVIPGRLTPAQYANNFCDSHAPLNLSQAKIEADRCYYCYDAPCQTACPTGIDVPSFIRRIADDNVRGAAHTILEANPLGGMCARVCPTEVLCEQACVRNTHEDKPVEIGLLQRYATDHFFNAPGKPLFTRAPATGRKVAVVGAGPAGLACAHGLAQKGHDVVLFDAHPKLGGLNEYGLATYKTVGDFAQKEVQWLLSIGGIEVRHNAQLGKDMALETLVKDYDAVFLGMGLAGVNSIGIPEAQASGIRNAVDFIADLRQASDLSKVPVGRKVVVIGGGMTAVDAAVQSKKLGAQSVTMVYRRGAQEMGASGHEQAWALENGVHIHHWAAPKNVVAEAGHVTGMQFACMHLVNGSLQETGEHFTLEADLILKAIGQSFIAQALGASVELQAGRIKTDEAGKTSHAKIWAGGDCRFGGRDLTVEAVEHGKVAALSIHSALSA